jgi:hypothetical protein
LALNTSLASSKAFESNGKSAIIVVDDCTLELHKRLAATVEHMESQLSLLTIDYEVVGVDEGAIKELEFVAQIAGVGFDVAYDHVQTLKERGIAQQRGRFVQIQPRPLALSLAADAWKRLSPTKIDGLVSNAIPTRLQVKFFDQLRGAE